MAYLKVVAQPDNVTVYENDRFVYTLGDNESILHEPLLDGDRGKPKAAYAIARLRNGHLDREVMTVSDVEKVRAASRARDSGPWVQWWDEMARKTVLRRLAKRRPSSSATPVIWPSVTSRSSTSPTMTSRLG